jgi:predicted porin
MKKSLIALAVASAVSAPAFAATSNVDVYGVLNMSVNRINLDRTGVDNSTSVTSNASRLGVKGSEDLGGGLAAIWQIESSIGADGDSAGSLNGRNTFVGLKGGFGTVLAGQHDTPMKIVGRLIDNFGDTLVDSRNLLGATGGTGASAFDLRTPNTIAYVSPAFSGLTVTAAYVSDFNANINAIDNNTTDAYSVNGIYKNGPMLLAAAYEKHNLSSTTDENMWRLVGGYSFGNAKLGALYENSKSDTLARDRSAWGVFANYAIGAITLKANYLTAGDYKGTNDSGAKQYTLGADYAMSKRTTAYAFYGKVKNDVNAMYTLGVGGGTSDRATATLAVDPSTFGVGVKHTF